MDSQGIVLADFLSYLKKERGFSVHTMKAYEYDLNRFISFVGHKDQTNIRNFEDIDRDLIRQYLGFEFDHGFSSKTVARRLAALKSFFNYLMRSERISDNPAIYVKSPKISQSLPNFIDHKVIDALMESPDVSTEIGVRDRAILELFYSTGIRLNELIMLDIGAVDSINQMIKVHGKGGKERLIPFGNKAKLWLEKYLKNRAVSFNSAWEKTPLFVNAKGGRILRLDVQRSTRNILKNLLMEKV